MVPISHLVLSAVQARILLVLLLEGPMTSSALSSAVGISESSWTKEKSILASCDLVLHEKSSMIGERGVIRKTNFALSSRGRWVAQNLLSISLALTHGASSEYTPTGSEKSATSTKIFALNEPFLSA